MGVAKRVEQRLEGLVEGLFARAFRSGVQPIEVGRRILREMAENKTISVNRTYAPNAFRVMLGPHDYERFEQMEAGLVREFSELIIDQAKEDRVNLMGMPRITFEEDESLGKGEFRVIASLAADAEIHRESGSAGPAPSGSLPELIRLEDGKPAEHIAIAKVPAVIGRLSTNEVVLGDPNVSRRHAELRREGDRWVLVDLGSTNGTLVNGKLAREHPLEDGDHLTFGSSELIFKAEGGS